MERTVKSAPKTFLSPGAAGWRVVVGSDVSPADDLLGAVQAVATGSPVTIALPARLAVFERMRLPAVDLTELEDMARLQLEKSLPYPLEEVSSTVEVLEKGESDSEVLVATVHQPQVTQFCQPLLDEGKWPDRVTLFVRHAAAACPPERRTLLVYLEEEEVVTAICHKGQPELVQTFHPADFDMEISSFLLNAELDGVNVEFDQVCLGEGCDALRDSLAAVTGAPIEALRLDLVPADFPGNLLPDAWREARKQVEQADKLRSYLYIAGAGWLGVIVVAILWVGWLQFRTNRIITQITKLQPQLELVQTRQHRWNELASAIDPTFYPVEVMRNIYESKPEGDVKFTQFEWNLDGFMVAGTAPTAGVAVEFLQKLRDNPALGAFTFADTTPQLMPDDKAQFKIIAKR